MAGFLFFIMAKTIAFSTLGCKLNFSETSGIAGIFQEKGYQRVPENQKADVYLINTCTVTELANKKSKQAIRKKIKQNPKAKIIVVGCYTQLKPDEVSEIEGVDLILGADNKYRAPELVDQLEKGNPALIPDMNLANAGFTPTYSFGDRTRSFLKVQDGCDYYCSYCTIPRARGNSRNNTIKETLKVASEIVEKGIQEIILTGVNIGDFGKSTGETFFQLIQALDKLKGLKRLRISSIEPNLLTNEILAFVAQSDVIVPHFHIPLQCGTDNLLRAMRRRYTTAVYQNRVEAIKKLMPDACIAADVIVGVPGETEQEFNQTLQFIKALDISNLHVFTYSERENTLAAKMPQKVPIKVKQQRSKIMHELGEVKKYEFYKQHLGEVREVLYEHQTDSKYAYGFTDNYIRVQIPVTTGVENKILKTRLVDLYKNNNMNGALIE